MALLLPPQIAAYAYMAGVTDLVPLARATAIAIAESGGNTQAHNGRGRDDSYGLWQINMYGDMGPARRTQFGITSNSQLYDPAVNARAMFHISGGGKNWQPWSTYDGLRYKAAYPAALSAAQAAIAAKGIQEVGQTVTGGVTDTLGAAKEALSLVAAGHKWITNRRNWMRILWWGAGAGLVLVGLSKATGTDKKAVQVVTSVVGGATGVAKKAVSK